MSTTYSATLALVNDEQGRRCVATQADPVIWVDPELWGQAESYLSDIPGTAKVDGERLTFGTEGEGLGRLTYERAGWHVDPAGYRWIVCERVEEAP